MAMYKDKKLDSQTKGVDCNEAPWYGTQRFDRIIMLGTQRLGSPPNGRYEQLSCKES